MVYLEDTILFLKFHFKYNWVHWSVPREGKIESSKEFLSSSLLFASVFWKIILKTGHYSGRHKFSLEWSSVLNNLSIALHMHSCFESFFSEDFVKDLALIISFPDFKLQRIRSSSLMCNFPLQHYKSCSVSWWCISLPGRKDSII